MDVFIDELWPDFESPMFACVNPSEICPVELSSEPLLIYTNNENIQPQPDPNYRLRRQLNLHKALSKQRQERLKARLERLPPRYNYEVRRASGKKMTGRERQRELERQEAEQLQLRDRQLDMISQLENKCNKLREILENIVATSPEYNNQILTFLETSELLSDKQEAI